MNCKSCNETLYNENDNERRTDSRRYPVKMKNGDIYCQACSDAYDVFFSPKKENITPVLESTPVKKIIPGGSFYTCRKCNNEASGSQCGNCGQLSPLEVARRMKTVKKRK